MRVTFTVGMGFNSENKRIRNAKSLQSKAIASLSNRFGGVTVYNGIGGWIDNNKLITEPSASFIIEAKKISKLAIRQTATLLRQMFNQTAVMVSISPSVIDMIF